jgi:acetyl-CoA carboxylase carboxyltransferase component
MVAAGMELKRLGLASKPLFVVPNHMLGQFSSELLMLYPGANILVAGKEDFEASKRRQLMSRIATGNWDAVIVTHSGFERIPLSDETKKAFFREQLHELEMAIREQRVGKNDRRIVKDLERAKKRLETRLKLLLAEAKKDNTLTFEELGGAMTHASISGVASFIGEDDEHVLLQVRYLLSFLPSNNLEDPPSYANTDDPDRLDEGLTHIVPDSAKQPYDMHDVIRRVVDDGEFLEIFPFWAMNIVIGLARLDGRSVGIIANQPKVLGGTLDIDASEKASRFVRFCDAFNIPIVTFVDVPGFLPGKEQEYGGIIRHGAKLLYSFAEATVPRMTVITRKAYGGAYVVMNSKHLRADVSFAWPTAEIAVMGAEGAVSIVFRREIDKATDPAVKRAELIDEYKRKFSTPYAAAERGFIDDVIEPAETRRRLIQSLRMLSTKRESIPARKHGNIPL